MKIIKNKWTIIGVLLAAIGLLTAFNVSQQGVAIAQKLPGALMDCRIIDEFPQRTFLLFDSAQYVIQTARGGIKLGVKRVRGSRACRWFPAPVAQMR